MARWQTFALPCGILVHFRVFVASRYGQRLGLLRGRTRLDNVEGIGHEKAQERTKEHEEMMRKWEDINKLCDVVRETSFAIHHYHRSGHLEKIYENALAHRLRKQALDVKQQYPLAVYDEDGAVLGEFFADLFIEDCLVVELKACQAIAEEHVAQLLGYLRASHIETGLLVNFGAPKLQIKKYLMSGERL